MSMQGRKLKHIVRLGLIGVVMLSGVAIMIGFRLTPRHQIENVQGALETALTAGKTGTWPRACATTLDGGRCVTAHMQIGRHSVPGARVELSVHVTRPEGMQQQEYKFVTDRSQEVTSK